MYNGIRSGGGIEGYGMVFSSYFIILVVFGNCILLRDAVCTYFMKTRCSLYNIMFCTYLNQFNLVFGQKKNNVFISISVDLDLDLASFYFL